jgi:hypothetical protein
MPNRRDVRHRTARRAGTHEATAISSDNPARSGCLNCPAQPEHWGASHLLHHMGRDQPLYETKPKRGKIAPALAKLGGSASPIEAG